ncbi:MAG TPA: (5-formylfuran-3-yl)methyl phosphate synthase [Gemmatimonadaceae bacterium]|nr:(5-formylfuran-3-yl)methyl phosphate synthase [Gemmatimonadaceae bacterium]
MRLLVSVRDAAEAEAALAGGADVIDAKEPSAGALGAVSPATLAAIVDAVGGVRPVSAALGDLGVEEPDELVARGEAFVSAGAAFVKVGFGVGNLSAAAPLAALLAGRVAAAGGALVFAAYADAAEWGWPVPDDVLTLSYHVGVAGLLLDTANKSGPGLLDRLPWAALAGWVARAHDAGLLVALAGGLAPADLSRVRDLAPDLIGVRGAACAGGRSGRIDGRRVAELVALVRGAGAEDDRRLPVSPRGAPARVSAPRA